MQLAPGAWRHAAVPAALALATLVVVPAAGVALLAVAGFVLLFFRDPERAPSEGADSESVLAPADGKVSVVRVEADDAGRERVRVGTFMNVTDVHVNRAPLPGTVASVEHVPGGHWPAFAKAAERNERMHYDVSGANEYRVTQIAGTVARRCHGYVDDGDELARGERFGHIAFSSRVDVVLPPRFSVADLRVEEGEAVRAGQTVLADDPGDEEHGDDGAGDSADGDGADGER